MPRFAANLSWLFAEFPLIERFAAAREAGFHGVEVLFPYEEPASRIVPVLAQTGLSMVLINCPPPNYADGPRGFAAVPGLQDRFRHDFRRSLRYARALGAEHLHIMAGTASGPDAMSVYVDNLRWAVAEAPSQSLTIEPINTVDMPGYFLDDFDLALEVVEAVKADNLSLQFDAYHAQRITGDVPGTWAKTRAHVRHVQVGGVPGRHEPAGGEIDYPAFFSALDAEGYDGWVSGEYAPAGLTVEGLAWIRQ